MLLKFQTDDFEYSIDEIKPKTDNNNFVNIEEIGKCVIIFVFKVEGFAFIHNLDSKKTE